MLRIIINDVLSKLFRRLSICFRQITVIKQQFRRHVNGRGSLLGSSCSSEAAIELSVSMKLSVLLQTVYQYVLDRNDSSNIFELSNFCFQKIETSKN